MCVLTYDSVNDRVDREYFNSPRTTKHAEDIKQGYLMAYKWHIKEVLQSEGYLLFYHKQILEYQ